MKKENSKDTFQSTYKHEICEAEKLVKELESPLGPKNLGDEAYELVKKELEEKRIKH